MAPVPASDARFPYRPEDSAARSRAASHPSSCPARRADHAPAPRCSCHQGRRAHQRRVAGYPLSATSSTPRTVRLNRLHLLRRLRQRRSRRITLRRVLRHRQERSRLQVEPLWADAADRPSSSRSSRPGPAETSTLHFRPFRERSKRANSARVGVAMPDASASPRTNASYECIPTLDAPHRRVRFQSSTPIVFPFTRPASDNRSSTHVNTAACVSTSIRRRVRDSVEVRRRLRHVQTPAGSANPRPATQSRAPMTDPRNTR